MPAKSFSPEPSEIFSQEMIRDLQTRKPLRQEPATPETQIKPLTQEELTQRYLAEKQTSEKFEEGRAWTERILHDIYAFQHNGEEPPEDDPIYDIETEDKFTILLGFYLDGGLERFQNFWFHDPKELGLHQMHRRGFLFQELVRYDPSLTFNHLPHDFIYEEAEMSRLQTIAERLTDAGKEGQHFVLRLHYPDALSTLVNFQNGDQVGLVEALAEVKSSLAYTPEDLASQLNQIVPDVQAMGVKLIDANLADPKQRYQRLKKYLIVPKDPYQGEQEYSFEEIAPSQARAEGKASGRYFADWKVAESCITQNDLHALEQILTGRFDAALTPTLEEKISTSRVLEKLVLGKIIERQLIQPDPSFLEWLINNTSIFKDFDYTQPTARGPGVITYEWQVSGEMLFPGENLPTKVAIKGAWKKGDFKLIDDGSETLRPRPTPDLLLKALGEGRGSCTIKHLEDSEGKVCREIDLFILKSPPVVEDSAYKKIALSNGVFTIEDVYQTPTEFVVEK